MCSSTLEAQEKIQAPVDFFDRSIRRKRNEIIKKWAGMYVHPVHMRQSPDKRGGGRKQIRKANQGTTDQVLR